MTNEQKVDFGQVYCTTDEAAALLHTSVGTLKWWRSEGRGPKFYKLGNRVLYKPSEVQEWVENGAKGANK